MLENYIKKIDVVNLFVLACVWWNLNNQIRTEISAVRQELANLDKRVTVIEMLLLQQNRMQSYVAHQKQCEHSSE